MLDFHDRFSGRDRSVTGYGERVDRRIGAQFVYQIIQHVDARSDIDHIPADILSTRTQIGKQDGLPRSSRPRHPHQAGRSAHAAFKRPNKIQDNLISADDARGLGPSAGLKRIEVLL